jgi:3'-phosphoadenosine 5'-phosphosulfate sulfotransferase (PAPS reductase)/FAD synthetase
LGGDAVTDPFLINGPAVISFSGGRTSAYMLWRILQAHGGTLPDDVVVCFANTGREMPATLDFVRDCGAAWNVPIVWLEYRWAPGGPFVEMVSHNSASRDGEPFAAFLRARSALPNPVQRSCTTELKIRTMKRADQGSVDDCHASRRGWDHQTYGPHVLARTAV